MGFSFYSNKWSNGRRKPFKSWFLFVFIHVLLISIRLHYLNCKSLFNLLDFNFENVQYLRLLVTFTSLPVTLSSALRDLGLSCEAVFLLRLSWSSVFT